MESLSRDLRVAFRGLTRQPSFSILAIFTLGLGIGGSTAIFSVIDAALLRPLPYPAPEQLVDITFEQPAADGQLRRTGPSLEDIRDWQSDGTVFSHVSMWRNEQRLLVDGPQLERVNALAVSEDYLGFHGVAPLLGRGIERTDTEEGAPAVVLIGYDFWQTRFSGDNDVIGRVIMIEDAPATIVGVLPPAFNRTLAMWRPFKTSAAMFARRGTGGRYQGRLRAGVSIEQARQILERITAGFARERGRPTAAAVRLDSLYEYTTSGYRQTTTVLAAAVTMILLIACVNVAGLLLARGTARGPELAVRVAMGATRIRVVRQLLTESVVLATMGGITGLALAWVSLDVLVANIPLRLPANSPVALNGTVLAFVGAVSVATGVLVGLYPALKLSRASVKSGLGQADRRHGSALSRRGGQALIGIEVALAIVLLAGAGLMIRSFERILSVDLGFDLPSIITMEVEPVAGDHQTAARFYPQLVQAIQQLPGIEAVGAVDTLAVGGSTGFQRVTTGGQPTFAAVHYFVPGYFEAMGMSLKHGRLPAMADQRSTNLVALLNESAVNKLFPGGTALGQRLEVTKFSYEVVGVVADVRHDGPMSPAQPEVFLSFGAAEASRALIVVARPRSGMPAIPEQMRQATNSLGTRALVHRIRRGSEWLGDTVITPRRRTVLLSILGGLGLLLTIVGVFGTTAYAVSRRTQEIGIRMAFGARPQQIIGAIVRDAMWPVAGGIVAGLAGATMASRLIASFLFETQPTDAPTYAAVAALLAAAVLIAAWIPSRHAARVDPVVALRQE
jgi:putative ABC transport system permease protein